MVTATSHDRIQKNTNTNLSLQLIPARTSVIKKVTRQLRSTIFTLPLVLPDNHSSLIKVNDLRAKLFIKYIVFAYIKV